MGCLTNINRVETIEMNYLFLRFTIYKILIPNACEQQICVVLIILIKCNYMLNGWSNKIVEQLIST